MASMDSYSKTAVERAMKVQEAILRAMAKRITWWQAAEIIGISDRHMRRWRERYEEFGYDGLLDRRLGRPSPRRVPMARAEKVLALYRESCLFSPCLVLSSNIRVNIFALLSLVEE
jgi:transposase